MITRHLRTVGDVIPLDARDASGDPPFVVGSPPQWDDASDSSYADVETFESPDVSYKDAARASLEVNPAIYPNAAGATVKARIRYKGDGVLTAPDVAVFRDDPALGDLLLFSDAPLVPGAASPTWYETTMVESDLGRMQLFIDRAREGGNLWLQVASPSSFGPSITYRRMQIFEAYLIVTTQGGIAPPCRLTGRGDGQDLGGGRLFPFAKTQQGGFRTSGTY